MKESILTEGPVTGEMIISKLNVSAGNIDRGGQSVFLGRVRADRKGLKIVKAIEYSAYGEMADGEAKKIKDQILEEFSDVREVSILHSLGMVMAGEVSLMVLVSAGHRRQAIDACSKTVELIKERLPVWKKEIYGDDTHEWVNEKLA